MATPPLERVEPANVIQGGYIPKNIPYLAGTGGGAQKLRKWEVGRRDLSTDHPLYLGLFTFRTLESAKVTTV